MCAGVWDKNKTYMHYVVLEKKRILVGNNTSLQIHSYYYNYINKLS